MASVTCFEFLFSYFLFNIALGDSGFCFNATQYLVKETGLGARNFWNSKAEDIEQCMKLCVRQRQCLSINYDLNTKMCELNKGFRKGGQSKSSKNLYSEFKSWPFMLDPNCFSRPCKDEEVCIPEFLLTSSATGDCAYSCFPFSHPVCPMPKTGPSNGRTIGSVNVVKCPKGKTGGGRAKCQVDLKWDTEIAVCVDIIDHSCTDNTLCSEIGAHCKDRKCQCLFAKYDVADSHCKPAVNPCAKEPCLNGGTCMSGADENYTCRCLNGYIGDVCEDAGIVEYTDNYQNSTNEKGKQFLESNNIKPFNHFKFKAKAPRDIYILLQSDKSDTDSIPSKRYNIIIGGWGNNISAIYSSNTSTGLVSTPDFLSANEYRPFWVSWNATTISVGNSDQVGGNVFMSLSEDKRLDIKSLGFSTGQKSTVYWRIPKALNECDVNPCLNGGVCKDGVYNLTCICPKELSGPTCAESI